MYWVSEIVLINCTLYLEWNLFTTLTDWPTSLPAIFFFLLNLYFASKIPPTTSKNLISDNYSKFTMVKLISIVPTCDLKFIILIICGTLRLSLIFLGNVGINSVGTKIVNQTGRTECLAGVSRKCLTCEILARHSCLHLYRLFAFQSYAGHMHLFAGCLVARYLWKPSLL